VQLLEAKSYIGKLCSIRWQERSGSERHIVSKVHDAAYVPLYGGYLVTDTDDIRLDRVISVALVEEPVGLASVRASVVSHLAMEKMAA
jgi:hypothetical protein